MPRNRHDNIPPYIIHIKSYDRDILLEVQIKEHKIFT